MALTSTDPTDSTVEILRRQLGAGLVHLERLPCRSAMTAGLTRPLPVPIVERLDELGLGDLWTHQAEAIDHLRAGRSTVIATGTASGKSLCYQVPIAEAVADRIRPGTALALFPALLTLVWVGFRREAWWGLAGRQVRGVRVTRTERDQGSRVFEA